MKTYSSWTTRELGMINPGKGLPLFPSEQFWSLQVMYCDPVGKQEVSAKKQQTTFHSPQTRLMLMVLTEPQRLNFGGQFLFALIDKAESAVPVC